ncbi:MAG: glycosyltransferase family 2 protein [Verrucomicrobiota bacterium]
MATLTPTDARVSVVMPVYNEAGTLREIIGRVLAQNCVQNLHIVDDASTDGSWEVLRELAGDEPRIELARQDYNQGKGAALRAGFALALAAGNPIILVQDADLEYDPEDYGHLIGPIVRGRADVVFGSRFLGGEGRVLYFWHSVGNRALTMLSNMCTDLNMTDMETCFKAFRREQLEGLELEEPRFGVEPEITAKLARRRPAPRIYEVAIAYHGRTYEQGKKITWRDGVHALVCILKYNLWR